MLIISRRCGESFVIGDDVKITVLSVKGNQIRIGIDAPKETTILREEVIDRRLTPAVEENKASSNS
ncbi:carbon storage regulator CsrA [Umboniibacter marinipuniceus]|uniref:Translational regulator CsrA n=1 Tax=Umboniibacter marinipuniceus TaxID=569599 RepID=A0A3M0A8H9_9GAMM|nr:carbon storage regulator CsrA [Umboniibacter marinipuniceus]RMA81413.1 carbon storage regulator CsrA [Umboniibacter marinipuniceus]